MGRGDRIVEEGRQLARRDGELGLGNSIAPVRVCGAPRRVATDPRGDFLVQLSIAMHKHAIYPPTHPMLSGAVDGVIARLSEMFGTRPTLSLGVARNQLVIEGIATDPDNPLLRELAQRLHRHHLGAVKFSLGVTSDQIADFLSTVAVDADRSGDPLGERKEPIEKWPHIRLYPLSLWAARAGGEKGGSRRR